MTDEQTTVNIFDKIRADTDEKRKARIEGKQKTIGELFNQPKGFHDWFRGQSGQPSDIHEWIETQNQAEQKGEKTNE